LTGNFDKPVNGAPPKPVEPTQPAQPVQPSEQHAPGHAPFDRDAT
jgi:sec-independent protein translocase protein TatB